MSESIRCGWANGSEAMQQYHDTEWGRPSRDDHYLFEMLTLEGAQAGLSWSTVLNKRDGYREAFDGFDIIKIINYDDGRVAQIIETGAIIRNRLKVKSVVTNARAFAQVQSEFSTFADYLWSFVNNEPIVNHVRGSGDVQASTDLSDRISKDMKKRGFKFVGTTIVYAYLQAVGIVDDHQIDCLVRVRQ